MSAFVLFQSVHFTREGGSVEPGVAGSTAKAAPPVPPSAATGVEVLRGSFAPGEAYIGSPAKLAVE